VLPGLRTVQAAETSSTAAGVARRATAGRQGRADADAGPGAAQRRRLIQYGSTRQRVSSP
jgi:hypothetical protein